MSERTGVTRSVQITAYCTPIPQGSMKAFVIRGGNRAGRAAVTSDNPKLKSFRQEVAIAAIQAKQGLFEDSPELEDQPTIFGKHEPVRVRMEFYFARPPSIPRKRLQMVVKPDLSKLLRAAEDALTGIIYADDAQIVRASIHKSYGVPERVEIFVESEG